MEVMKLACHADEGCGCEIQDLEINAWTGREKVVPFAQVHMRCSVVGSEPGALTAALRASGHCLDRSGRGGTWQTPARATRHHTEWASSRRTSGGPIEQRHHVAVKSRFCCPTRPFLNLSSQQISSQPPSLTTRTPREPAGSPLSPPVKLLYKCAPLIKIQTKPSMYCSNKHPLDKYFSQYEYR